MTLSDGRVVKGKFQCMDRLRNFILVDAEETRMVAITPGARAGDRADRRRPGRAAPPGEPCGIVVNVSAVEGKFAVPKKFSGHPHTNMGKAALNMLTYTSAHDLFARHRILMNCARGSNHALAFTL